MIPMQELLTQNAGRDSKAPRPAPNGRAYRLLRKIFSTSSVVSLW